MRFALEAVVPSLAADLAEHNERLRREGRRWRLEIRGGRLCLWGPLPPVGTGADPEAGRTAGLRMQRLSLGLPADPEGLAEALLRLAQLERELALGSFRWSDWRRRRGGGADGDTAGLTATRADEAAGGGTPARTQPPPQAQPALQELQQRLASFERAFFADPRRRRRVGSRTTWTAAYLPYLRRLARHAARQPRLLARDGGPSLALLEEVLESYDLASRSRQQCAIALAALARQGGLPLPDDWRERGAGYGLHLARFRQLPSDGEILELIERIPSPSWRLAYGLMATYGLRNHEVFFCDASALGPGGDRVLRVLPTSKTGEHQCWPFQPDWVERFELPRLARDRQALPRVRTDLGRTTLQQVGRRVAEQFRRYDLPITPYDLRHAWAVRTIHLGLPDTVAARMMGHSVAIHTRTYHHWITRRDQQQAVDAALQRLQRA